MIKIILASTITIVGLWFGYQKINNFRNDPRSEIIDSIFDFIFFFPGGFLYPLIMVLVGVGWLVHLLIAI